MDKHERTEQIRQAIMRLRELLDIMQHTLDRGEREYDQLFALLSAAERDELKEKDQQWMIAERLLNDPSPVARTALTLRFQARDLERAFEEVHDHVIGD